MKNLFLLGLALIMGLSCNRHYKRVHFKMWATQGMRDKRMHLHGKVPSGYSLHEIIAGAEAGRVRQYVYADSSIIYISNNENLGTSNDSNIDMQKDKKVVDGVLRKDVHEWQGCSNDICWKEIFWGNLSVGYTSVKINDTGKYERAIGSIRRRHFFR